MAKKDDAFVLKERGVVTTTIAGSGIREGRLLYAGDGFEIRGNDYNTFNIKFPSDYTLGQRYDMSDNKELYQTMCMIADRATLIECSIPGSGRSHLIRSNPVVGNGDRGFFTGTNGSMSAKFQFTIYLESSQYAGKFLLSDIAV